MIELDELLEDLEDGRCDVPRALERLEEIDASKGRYGAVASAAAFGMSAGCAAVFLGGGLWECLAAAVLGLLLFVLGLLVARSPERVDVSDAWLAFSAGLAGLAWNRWVVPVDYQIVTLSALIILIPGLSFTVAMLELATRHLVSGVARLAGAGATMLTIVLGVPWPGASATNNWPVPCIVPSAIRCGTRSWPSRRWASPCCSRCACASGGWCTSRASRVSSVQWPGCRSLGRTSGRSSVPWPWASWATPTRASSTAPRPWRTCPASCCSCPER
ncbi:MAG: threonine/serine exporter family protein [Planctomycetota bacterium]